MLITVEHLRERGHEKHSVRCARQACEELGIDFRDFVRNGVDHTRLIEGAQQRVDIAELLEDVAGVSVSREGVQ